MNSRYSSRAFASVLWLAVVAVTAAAPFSAELALTRNGEASTGTFQGQGDRYRFDFTDKGQPLYVLYEKQSGLTRLVAPREKAYFEGRDGEPMTMFANPFSAFAHLSKTKTVRADGTESVAGVVCRKQVVLSGEQVWIIGWLADDFDVPLRVEIPLYGLSVELRNVKRGPQDAALFALPTDYRLKAGETEPEHQPDWVSQVAAAPTVTLPAEKTLRDSEIVRVRTQAGRWVSVTGTNLRADQGSFTVLPFKGGKSLGASEMATTFVDAHESGSLSVGSQPANADELAVRVGEGPMKLQIAYVTLAEGQSGAVPASPSASAAEPSAANAAVNAPTAVAMASRFEVSWTGLGAADDFIAIARAEQPAGTSVSRARTSEGNPLKLWAPSEPGAYEVRYVQGRGRTVLAKVPLTVEAVTAAVEPPSTANVAARIEVKWQGPAADGDFISVARPNLPAAAAVVRVPVRNGNPAKLWLPADAGQYEVRYILARGLRQLATAPIVIQAVNASVEIPAPPKAGAMFEVRWQGPGYPEDIIAVARAGQPPTASLSSTKVRPGVAASVRAPREPGTYEVRYVLGHGPRVLATAVVTIKADEASVPASGR